MEKFPNDKQAIESFFNESLVAKTKFDSYFTLKLMPIFIRKFLLKWFYKDL